MPNENGVAAAATLTPPLPSTKIPNDACSLVEQTQQAAKRNSITNYIEQLNKNSMQRHQIDLTDNVSGSGGGGGVNGEKTREISKKKFKCALIFNF
jgi:hypothetical protein